MRRGEKVEATLTAEEKEILQRLCDEAGCTEAELIRSVLISRSISLDDLETGKKIEHEKIKRCTTASANTLQENLASAVKPSPRTPRNVTFRFM